MRSARSAPDNAGYLAPVARIEQHVRQLVLSLPVPVNLRDAIAYATEGGKRVRPLLAWHAACAAGGRGDAGLDAGAAVELVHAFSLVHDDLPALDDDDLRRGRPTLHRHAGEAMAILAGDAMLALSFGLLARTYPGDLGDRLTAELAGATTAMIAGQVRDTLGFPDGPSDPLERLAMVHRDKTGALIRASCRMGALIGLADGTAADGREQLDRITRYGESVGLMFQVVDDLLDVLHPTEHVGKRTGKDAGAGKVTYPALMGVDGSRHEVERLRDQALTALESLEPHAEGLRDFCEALAVRTR